MERSETSVCQLCGAEIDSRAVKKHDVVPREIMAQARIRRARIVRLCPNCSVEIGNWYRAKVDRNIFDTQIKRFRERLPAELVKEYEGAYNRFARYKKIRSQPA